MLSIHCRVCQWSQEQEKGRLTYVLLLDRGWLHEKLNANTYRKQQKQRMWWVPISCWDSVHQNIPHDSKHGLSSGFIHTIPNKHQGYGVQCTKCGHKHHWVTMCQSHTPWHLPLGDRSSSHQCKEDYSSQQKKVIIWGPFGEIRVEGITKPLGDSRAISTIIQSGNMETRKMSSLILLKTFTQK